MAELPVVSGREAVKVFGKIGYRVDRQRGSHIVLRQAEPPHRRLTIPDHKEARKGTLRALIRQAGLTVASSWRSNRNCRTARSVIAGALEGVTAFNKRLAPARPAAAPENPATSIAEQ